MRDMHKLAAQPVTILLVDDDADCRQLIRDEAQTPLTEEGHHHG